MDILFFSLLTNLLYFCSGRLFINQNKASFDNQFYVYFIGFIIISSSALLINFFVSLSPSNNTVIYSIIIFIFIIKSKFKFHKNEIVFLIFSTFITFSLIIFSNINRPDAGLYHLPYISILNESKIIFGINNIHFRFGHTSILQYTSAINNNFLFKENGISIPLASIVSFFYIYFLNEVWKVIKKKDAPDISDFFSLFILIYISYKIIRYSSFGNDAVPHLTFFYLISYILKNSLKNIDFNKTFLISVFIFINKTTLGLVFIIPGIIFFLKKDFLLKRLFHSLYSFPLLLLFLWITKNLLISGCLVYPAKITCIDKLSWTDKTQILKTYKESQAWSKGWPDRKDKNINMSDFNKNFNWVSTWSSKHLKYILKIILPYILVLSLITFYIKKSLYAHKEKYIDIDLNKRIYLLFLTSLVGTISFFLVFPIYRYGYSFLVTLIALILILILKNNRYLAKKKLFTFVFFISIFLFSIKQVQKIYLKYENNRWPNIYTLNEKNVRNEYKEFKISEKFKYFLAVSGNSLCMYSKAPCTSYIVNNEIKHKKFLGYSVLFIN